MKLLKLKVVVWKNFVIRKRHWLLTILESLLPVSLFFLVAFARSEMKGFQKIKVNVSTHSEPVPITYDTLSGETHLLFAPDNIFYGNIIHKTMVKTQLPNDLVKGFDSEEKLIQYYNKNHNDTVLAIIFKGYDPKHLDYVIRYHDQYGGTIDFLNTGQLYHKKLFQYQQHRDVDYLWKGIIALQKAIDISFIEESLGKEIDNQFSLYLKEFPYPPYEVDEALTVFMECLPLLTLFSFILICPAVLKRVVEEKQTGAKELLKMAGMESWMFWLGWFIYGMIPMLLSITLIVIFMKVPLFGSEYPPIEYTDGTVLFCFLLLYCMAANVFCFAVSSCFNNSSAVMVAGILLWIVSYFVPKYFLGSDECNKYSWIINLALNILPNMSLHYGYSIMSSFEERELGMKWSNIMKSSSGGSDDITMLHVFLMLIFDMVVYMLFTFYMDKVNPGQYGIPKSVFFPLKKLIKRFSRKSTSHEDENQLLKLRRIEEGFNQEKCIELKDVSKFYGPQLSVNKLNLDIYKNQITIMLGHNGAGKSTTMSMLTGLLEVSSGSIYIDGLDIKENMEQIRSKLGLCPQHNLLFSDLNVEEHLLLFAQLKGQSIKEASAEVDHLLRKLSMNGKKHEMAHTLSGGMKRKLCLGMAVIGNTSVLILDEPSAGMDLEARRELWDLLLEWRNSKTILITTHFMEEADALGDWIAIMSDGRLKCYGTPLFLKKKYETGYHLTLMTAADSKETINNIIAFVTNEIKDCLIKTLDGRNLSFLLPFENKQISIFLTKLEQEKGKLGIENISVNITTLEDLFLRTSVIDLDEDSMNSEPQSTKGIENLSVNLTTLENLFLRTSEMDLNGGSIISEPESTKESFKPHLKESSTKKRGYERKKLQFTTLINKRLRFFNKMKFNYIFLFSVAVMFFSLTSYFSRSSGNYYTSNASELKLELGIYKKSSVLVNGSEDEDISKYQNIYKQLILDEKSLAFHVANVENEILKKAIDNIVYYKEHIITSAEFSKSNKEVEAFALYNSFALHSSPISLNLITNTIAKVLLNDEYSISISNWPLEAPMTEFLLVGYSETKISLLWLVMVPLGCLFILGSFIIFPHAEIRSNFVKLQYMCGVEPLTYWAINLLVDLLTYLLVMICLSSIICSLSQPFQGIHEFATLYSILVLYGIAGIPFTYLFCRKETAIGAFTVLVKMGIFLGILLTLVIGILSECGDEFYEQLARKLKIVCFLFLPQVGLSFLLIEFSKKAVKNYNMVALPKQMMSQCTYDPNPCCKSLTSSECSKFRGYSDELDMWWLMVISFMIFFTINCLWDSYILKKLLNQIFFKIELIIYKVILRRTDRYAKTNKGSDGGNKQHMEDTLRAEQLFKSYSGNPVVKHININLNKQECIGILGINGSGKTTTLRMLTRDECFDGGTIDLTISNKKLNIGDTEYLEYLGYCPQNDALNDFLTGREILTVIANLRGKPDPINDVLYFLELCELTKYADILCKYYSGGNKRKLSLAIALIGLPKFVLLDEPTNGVDPLSRRKFWSLIKTIQQRKEVSFILNSHSMEECEALCDSLKIMENGIFEKEGSIRELKEKYGGFSVKLKLKSKYSKKVFDEIDSEKELAVISGDCEGSTKTETSYLNVIKKNIEDSFKNKTQHCEIKDAHSGLLHYYMKGNQLRWSNIFEDLEKLKDCYSDMIEDYSISEASLEDVFLAVTKNNKYNNM